MDPRLIGRSQHALPKSQSSSNIDLQVAKGQLVGRLTTSDPRAPKLLSTQINDFHASLVTACEGQAPLNHEFDKCAAWIVCHVARSSQRTSALGTYLVKLIQALDKASSVSRNYPHVANATQEGQGSSAQMKILSLVDSVLAIIGNNTNHALLDPNRAFRVFGKHIAEHVVELVRLTTNSDARDTLQTHLDLSSLLGVWTQGRYFSRSVRMRLREVARDGYSDYLARLRKNNRVLHDSLLRPGSSDGSMAAQMPDHHGSFDDAWYSLPVGSSIPLTQGPKALKISAMKPLRMNEGRADPELLEAVHALLQESKKISSIPNIAPYDQGEDVTLDGLGQRIFLSRTTGKRKREDTYYAQKIKFAQCMHNIRKKPTQQSRSSNNVNTQVEPPVHSIEPHRFPPIPPPPPPPPPPDAMARLPAGWQPPPPPPPIGGMPIPPPFPIAPNSYGRGGSNAWRGGGRGQAGIGGSRDQGGGGRGGWQGY